jgi:hypothetical protein
MPPSRGRRKTTVSWDEGEGVRKKEIVLGKPCNRRYGLVAVIRGGVRILGGSPLSIIREEKKAKAGRKRGCLGSDRDSSNRHYSYLKAERE